MTVMCVGAMTFALYGIIRFRTLTQDSYWINAFLNLCMFCLGFVAVTLNLMAAAFSFSNSTKALLDIKLKLPQRTKYYKKKYCSLFPFGVRYGPLKAVKYKHVFDCYEAVLNILVVLLFLKFK